MTSQEPPSRTEATTRIGERMPLILPPAKVASAGTAGAGVPTESLATPGPRATAPGGPERTVEQVADSVIAAMRRVSDAHERHLESLELETARRGELLTAQAELDAELIRLHARREAQAIVSAARPPTEQAPDEVGESDQLGGIGETLSRFAETIETIVASSPTSPDHPRTS